MPLVPRVIARHWRLKLAAFGLTVVLWALVRTESGFGNLFTIPVQAQVGDVDWTLLGDPDPATVQVRFRGPTEDLIRLAREGTTLRVPLDSVTDADTLLQLRRDWVVVGAGSRLVVEEIAPASVRLTLQRAVSRAVTPRVTTTGELPSGLALAAPIAPDPQRVTVRGAASHVREVSGVSLAPLDLGKVSASGVFPVSVDTTGLAGLTVTPPSIALGVRLEPAVERELTRVPVVVGRADDGATLADPVTIRPAAIAVRLRGARTVVAAARADEVRAVVPFEAVAGLAAGQERRVPVRLRGVPALARGFAEVDSVVVRRGAAPRAARGGSR